MGRLFKVSLTLIGVALLFAVAFPWQNPTVQVEAIFTVDVETMEADVLVNEATIAAEIASWATQIDTKEIQ